MKTERELCYKYISVNLYYRRLWDKMFGTDTEKELRCEYEKYKAEAKS